MKIKTREGMETEIVITEPLTEEQWKAIGKTANYRFRLNKPKEAVPATSALPEPEHKPQPEQVA